MTKTPAELNAEWELIAADLGEGIVTAVERAEADASANAVKTEREAIAAWLRSEPETIKECNGHRHKDGKKCLVITPMTLEELADAIAKGDYPREKS